MPNILAVAATTADSTEFTLASGGEATLLLINAAGGQLPPLTRAVVQQKGSNDVWMTVGAIQAQSGRFLINGAGTYRVQRTAGPIAFGVDQN